MASELSSGRELDGESRLSALEDTRIDHWVSLQSSSVASTTDQHLQAGANAVVFLCHGRW